MEKAALDIILGTGTYGAIVIILGTYSWKIIDRFLLQRFDILDKRLEARDKERAEESKRREDMLLQTIEKYEKSQERNQKIILEQAKNFEILKDMVKEIEGLKDVVVRHISKEE